MIALGWTYAGADLPPDCRPVDSGDMSLVAVDDTFVPGARDKIRLLLACAAHCDPFVPYPPGSRVQVADVLARPAWSDLASRLSRADGAVQITLAVRAHAAEGRSGSRHANGRDWLRARAAVHAAEAEDDALRRAALAGGLAATGGCLVSQRPGDRGTAFDCLARRPRAEEALERLADAVRACRAFAGRTVRITGPWPVFALAPRTPR